MRLVRQVLGVSLALWLLLGLGYPLVTTAIAGVLFPRQAAGSPVVVHGVVVAAQNVGQSFGGTGYFWGRPSATVSLRTGRPEPYNALNSGPSNLGPSNPVLLARIRARIRRLVAATPGLTARRIPADLVEGSGSGLDPDISPAAARIQIPRVARATGLSRAFLGRLVAEFTRGPEFGLIGRPTVNVTELNLRLAEVLGQVPHGGGRGRHRR